MDRSGSGNANISADPNKFTNNFYFLFLSLVTVLAVMVAWPLIMPILLAVITAGLAEPLNDLIRERTSGRTRLAAAITLTILIFAIVIPLAAIGFLAVTRLVEFLNGATESIESFRDELTELIQGTGDGFVGTLIGPGGLATTEQVADSLSQSIGPLVTALTDFATRVPRVALIFLIYLYSLYFFLIDGEELLINLQDVLPLKDREKRAFGATFLKVSRATIKGTLVIGAIQGLIGGLLFLILGLPMPLIFGVLFALLAAIPNFGAILIWLPASIILIVQGQVGRGVLLGALGGGFIGAVDYVIRPAIIREDAQLHQVLVIAGIIGGISLFGVPGLLIGPIVMSLFVAAWRTFRTRYRSELEEVADGNV